MAAFQGKYGEIASRQKEYKKKCSNLSAQKKGRTTRITTKRRQGKAICQRLILKTSHSMVEGLIFVGGSSNAGTERLRKSQINHRNAHSS